MALEPGDRAGVLVLVWGDHHPVGIETGFLFSTSGIDQKILPQTRFGATNRRSSSPGYRNRVDFFHLG
ncbi:MAG: hypothetical protein GDA48_12030 [Hormoscilla sp. GM102CHS1]|nr:hypothetical protein [Hormoscilla sp. GM102CHS1]